MSQELNYLFDLLKLKYGREALFEIFINLLNEELLYERRTDKATNHKARRQADKQ